MASMNLRTRSVLVTIQLYLMEYPPRVVSTVTHPTGLREPSRRAPRRTVEEGVADIAEVCVCRHCRLCRKETSTSNKGRGILSFSCSLYPAFDHVRVESNLDSDPIWWDFLERPRTFFEIEIAAACVTLVPSLTTVDDRDRDRCNERVRRALCVCFFSLV